MKLQLLISALALVACTSAFAMHCPLDMQKIDAALATDPNLSAQQLAQVKNLRTEGEQLHNAGRHQESVDTLGEAMRILGIE
jgi:hypothetical protein